MSIFLRRIILALLGLSGGLLCWPVQEILLGLQVYFPDFLLFSLLAGGIFGLIFGAFFASAEGIIAARWHRIFQGMGWGALIGALGGTLGFLLAQGVFFWVGEQWAITGERVTWLGLPLTRALGWGVLGAFVGSAEGFRVLSLQKLWVGLVGGLVGGSLGGAVLEYLKVLLPDFSLGPLVGLAVFGILLGIAYGFVEKSLSFGVLRLLNGRLKGKEFILNQRKLVLGTGAKSDILLTGYRDVAGDLAQLQVQGRELSIISLTKTPSVLVNDEPVEQRILKYEDVIKIGSAKLYYKHE